jgi:predicted transcriptional regulator
MVLKTTIERNNKMATKIDFREQVKALMEKKDISISKLSRLADVHQDSLYRFVNGHSSLFSDTLEKILNVLYNL